MALTNPITNPPAIYFCALSRALMDDPVMARCGHLFNRNVVAIPRLCPLDGSTINPSDCIPFSELRAKITVWKAQYAAARAQSSYAQSVAGGGAAGAAAAAAAPQSGGTSRTGSVQPDHIVSNVHRDDIHGLIAISSTHFVSGSKDNTLRMWKNDGELVSDLTTNAFGVGYKYWVTALATCSDGNWVSGTRNGNIDLWNPQGQKLLSCRYQPSAETQSGYKCKERNKQRINCITHFQNDLFYIGTPRFVHLWDKRTGSTTQTYAANENDWVYCVNILQNHDLLVVIGTSLEHWSMASDQPGKTSIIRETPQEHRARQRPHISAIKLMEHDPNFLSAAVFDGSVRLVDLTARTTFQTYREHVGRVWSVINLRPHVIASSADDRTIKIWDARQPRSAITLSGAPGRVSSLLRIDPHTFISGACPNNPFQSQSKAEISFWDIRKVTPS